MVVNQGSREIISSMIYDGLYLNETKKKYIRKFKYARRYTCIGTLIAFKYIFAQNYAIMLKINDETDVVVTVIGDTDIILNFFFISRYKILPIPMKMPKVIYIYISLSRRSAWINTITTTAQQPSEFI